MRILVTGGAGYIGSTCARRLIKEGHTVFVLDDYSIGAVDPHLPESCLCLNHNLIDFNAVFQTLKILNVEAVLHFAALTSVPDSLVDPERYWHTNLVGTFNLLRAMRHCGVKRIIFSSTAAVYAPSNDGVSENSPLAPTTPYGKSKLAAENLIRDFSKAHDINHTIFRYFNVGGADEDYRVNPKHEGHVIPLLLKTALGQQKKFTVFGGDYDTMDGTCLRDYIHVNDVVQAHVLALASPHARNGTFNLGTETAHSVLEIIETCEKVTGKEIPFSIAPRRAGDAPVVYACATRAKAFGWSSQHDLTSIIRSSYQSYLRR